MLNDVRMADIHLVLLVYLLVYASTYFVPTALLRQNKPFPLLCLGHAQIIRELPEKTQCIFVIHGLATVVKPQTP